jgi:hypothetical protein
MSDVRDHLVLFWIVVAVGCVALVRAGLDTWNPWLQLAAPVVLGVICTRVFAPVYYGWREPEDHPRNRARH